MSTDNSNKSSTSPFKRKATEVSDTQPNLTRPTELKKLKTDTPQQTMSNPYPPSSSSSTTNTPPTPLLPQRPQPPGRGDRQSPPPSNHALQAILNGPPPEPTSIPPSAAPSPLSPDAFPGLTEALAREATRMYAANHLKRARNELVENIRVSGLNRQILPEAPNSTALTIPPPPPSPPSSPPLPSSQNEQSHALGITEFAGLGQGKQDWEINEGKFSGWELGSFGGIRVAGGEVTGYVEGSWKTWKQQESEWKEKRRARKKVEREKKEREREKAEKEKKQREEGEEGKGKGKEREESGEVAGGDGVDWEVEQSKGKGKEKEA
ncbi:MAG: hypothetical protein Q9166_005419 [cf. Caloplaca sp. 2 TL-2023]